MFFFYNNDKTYFCKIKDKHHEKYAPCNDIDYIGNWYYSMKKQNLYGIVFYDSCSQEFIDTYGHLFSVELGRKE